jgi:death on curing protein
VSDPVFLTLAEVIEVHVDQIRRYGGQSGLRDWALLQSALAQPQASFAGQWLHKDLYTMAAAYSYHLCQNHPFVDGNKRTALASALVFLELNGISLLDPRGRLKNAMFRMASGKMGKEEFARLIKKLPRER